MDTVSARRDTGFRGTTQAQIIGMAVAFAVCILILMFSRGIGAFILLFSGIIVYVVLRLFGVRKPEIQLGFGAVLVVSAILIGGLAVSPTFLDATGDPSAADGNGFTSASVVDNGDGTFTISVSYETGNTLVLTHGEMAMVGYSGGTHGPLTEVPMTESSGVYSATVSLESGKIHIIGFKTSDDSAKSFQFNYSGTVDGSQKTMFCLKWNAYFVLVNVAFAYFLVVLVTAWMRKKTEALRAKLEAEGRLFPPGYGRCAECGSLIMPGMFNCRKCGAPVPEELRPETETDGFECTACGAKVGEDDKVCPGCGASFEDDGSMFECTTCGASVPEDAKVCPNCGEPFEDEESDTAQTMAAIL